MSNRSKSTKNSKKHITKISATAKPTGAKPTDTKPADAKLATTESMTTKSTDAQPTDAKPTTAENTKQSPKSTEKSKPTAKPTKSKKSEKTAEKPLKEVFLLARPFVAFARYLRDSWREIRQVRWPSRKLTWKMTLAVLFYCAIFVAFLVLLDTFFTFVFNLLLNVN